MKMNSKLSTKQKGYIVHRHPKFYYLFFSSSQISHSGFSIGRIYFFMKWMETNYIGEYTPFSIIIGEQENVDETLASLDSLLMTISSDFKTEPRKEFKGCGGGGGVRGGQHYLDCGGRGSLGKIPLFLSKMFINRTKNITACAFSCWSLSFLSTLRVLKIEFQINGPDF